MASEESKGTGKKSDAFRRAAGELTRRGKRSLRVALIVAAVVGFAMAAWIAIFFNPRRAPMTLALTIAFTYVAGRIFVRWRTGAWIRDLATKHGVPAEELVPVLNRFL